MSSYVSSRYYIERNRRVNIENQCRRELAAATERANANREAYLNRLALRQQKEEELQSREAGRKGEVHTGALQAAVRRKDRRKKIAEALKSAEILVRDCEAAFGVNEQLRGRLDTLQSSFAMFGPSDRLLQETEEFCTAEVPARREALRAAAEQKRVERVLEGVGAIRSTVRDGGSEFVSLKESGAAARRAGGSPWELFLARLAALKAEQEAFDETAAAELLAEAEALPAARRNGFLLRRMAELEAMEQEAAALRAGAQAGARQTEEAYAAYLAVCELSGAAPQYRPEELSTPAAVYAMQRRQEELWAGYLRKKEQQYATNAISEVLEEFGIQFESMEESADGTYHLEYAIDEQAGLVMTRTESGAFEMQFRGNTAGQEASQDERRQIVEKAHTMCSLLPSIAARLRERGVVFDQTMTREPDEDTVEIRRSRSAARRGEGQALRQMTL